MAKDEVQNELTLEGSAKPQMKRIKHSITEEQQEAFFEKLAQTCNVKYSAQEAGISPSGAYNRKARDAAFATRWTEALAQGYGKLEMLLVERAIKGTEKITTHRDGSVTRVREYPNALAMNLLKMHHQTVADHHATSQVDEEEVREARANILHKLEKLADTVEAREKAQAKRRAKGAKGTRRAEK